MNDDDDHLLNSIASEEDLFEDLFEMSEPFEEVPISKNIENPYKRGSEQCECFSKLSLFKISERNEESEYT